MLKELIKFANKLDTLGLTKEADKIDHLVRIASYKLLGTWAEGTIDERLPPEEKLKFQIKYVLDIIFDSDYQFGPGGDLSDMPQSTKNVLTNYAFEKAKLNSFDIEDFLAKIRKMFPAIDTASDMYAYNAIRDDLKEIVEMQKRYQEKIAPKQTPAAPAAPVAPDYKSVAERMSEKLKSAPEVGKPVTSVTPQVRSKPYTLSEAIADLPSSSALPEGISSTRFNKPSRGPR